MTGAEWLACCEPFAMLEYLERRISDRKLRLFACGFAAGTIGIFSGSCQGRQAVLVAERFADGLVTPRELEEAQEEAVDSGRQGDGRGAVACCHLRPDRSFPRDVAQVCRI